MASLLTCPMLYIINFIFFITSRIVYLNRFPEINWVAIALLIRNLVCFVKHLNTSNVKP